MAINSDSFEGEKVFQNIKALRVSDQIVQQIQQLIIDGKLEQGDKLPGETELSLQFGVSRASVREALSILESRGILERHKNGGTFLCKLCLERILEEIDLTRKPDAEMFEDLYEARKLIEIKTVELACIRANEFDFSKIEKTIKMMEESLETGDSGIEADILFHQCIAVATKNTVLAGIIQSMGSMLKERRKLTLTYPGRLAACLEEHRNIYRALQAGDIARCTALLEDHFGEVETIRKAIDGHGKNS